MKEERLIANTRQFGIWDVPDSHNNFVIRKFSSPVYGQQVMAHIRDPSEPEILSVVDHPRLEHDWLWKLVAVSKIRQDVTDKDLFDPSEDVPNKPEIQILVRPDKIIKLQDPTYDTDIDFPDIARQITEDEIETAWISVLDKTFYDKERWAIAKIKIDEVFMKKLRDKRIEVVDGINDYDFEISGKFPRDVLENKFKTELLDQCAKLLMENGFGSMLREKLYFAMLKHIREKIFSGKSLSDAHYEDVEFALDVMPEIKKNFTNPIIAGIIGDNDD